MRNTAQDIADNNLISWNILLDSLRHIDGYIVHLWDMIGKLWKY